MRFIPCERSLGRVLTNHRCYDLERCLCVRDALQVHGHENALGSTPQGSSHERHDDEDQGDGHERESPRARGHSYTGCDREENVRELVGILYGCTESHDGERAHEPERKRERRFDYLDDQECGECDERENRSESLRTRYGRAEPAVVQEDHGCDQHFDAEADERRLQSGQSPEK